MATNLDVITRALRRLGVVAKDDAPGADDLAQGTDILAGIYAEIAAMGLLLWPDDDVPATVYMPLTTLLACEMAQDYSVAPPMSRAGAMLRLLAVINSDDRTNGPDDYNAAGYF